MKKYLLPILILLLPLVVLAQSTKKVLIIGIDGCRSDALQAAETPNLDKLIAKGIFSPDAINDDITISGPSWSAILCGVWSDKHLVTNNSFNGSDYDSYPHVFKHLNDFDPNLNTVSICRWGPINDFIVQDHADFKWNTSSDLEVATEAATYFAQNDPDVMFLHFDDVDHAGHGHGFAITVPEYRAAIEDVDAHVGTVIEALEQRPNYPNEDWLVLVTTDHGGIGTSHGGSSIEEENVFIIASGNYISPRLILKDSSIVTDNFFNCLGDSVELHFDGVDDQVQIASNPLFDFGEDQDFTIECRVRTAVAADVAIVGNKDWDSGLNKGFVFSFKYPSGPEWKVNIGDGSNRADLNTGGTIADKEWHTLSVTFDRDGLMRMYQDGAIVDSTDISSIGDITTSDGLFLGTDINGAYDYSGAIAELRVWNTVLDRKAIQDWHCTFIEDSHPNYGDLTGYWKLNEGMGTNPVSDYSGNNNSGQLQGTNWKVPDSTVVYDYSSTSRLTDIIPTALRHLCIPIAPSWNLDGTSLIPECILTNTEAKPKFKTLTLELSPNPANTEVQLHLSENLLNQPLQLEVYDLKGSRMLAQTISKQDGLLDVSAFTDGVYYLKVKSLDFGWISRKLIILRH